MSGFDYDKSEPKLAPVVLSIFVTMIFIFISTLIIIYYFKGSLKNQEDLNESVSRNNFELMQLKKWENKYLNSENEDKITIDDAIFITITRFNSN